MSKTIVFILTSSVNTNSIKRIEEFISRGYEVKAFGFSRDLSVPNKPKGGEINVVGIFRNDLSYPKRCSTLFKGIRSALQETKQLDCIYYLVGLDVAIFYRLQTNKPYIFEEADLVHTNFNKYVKSFYENLDKRIIGKSILSVFRSEGFIRYHFGDNPPANVLVIPNRLNSSILDFPRFNKQDIDLNNLKIGFVGMIRYKTVLNFAKVFCAEFPHNEFHFYGAFTCDETEQQFKVLQTYPNCFFHGAFKSPDDLNHIYSRIDLVLSTYDVTSENVRYAEPNKIYEAIFFDTPIIVSSDTFLAQKVKSLGIGFDIDPWDDKIIIDFIKSLSQAKFNTAIKNIERIDKRSVINTNDVFFDELNKFFER